MAGPLASAIQGKYNKEAAKDAAKLAAKQQRAGIQLINELDFEPMYASERVPTFQRSESPLARSYIDSFLMGNNPAAVRSTAPNAALQKASLQRQQNAAFGTPAERLLRQREVQAATPWAVTPPTRTVRSTVPENAAWTAQNGESAGVGINKNVSDALRDTGTDVGALQAKRDGRGGNLGAAMQVKETQNLIEQLMRTYEGDADRLAADIRSAGGVIPLAKKTRR